MTKYYLTPRGPHLYLVSKEGDSTVSETWLRNREIKYRSLKAAEFLGSGRAVEIDEDEYIRIKKEYA